MSEREQFVKTTSGSWINTRYVVEIGAEEMTRLGVCREYKMTDGVRHMVSRGSSFGFPSADWSVKPDLAA